MWRVARDPTRTGKQAEHRGNPGRFAVGQDEAIQQLMRLVSFILFSAIAMAANDSDLPLPTAEEVVARMVARDKEHQPTLYGYTATRRYVLENQRHNRRAEMLVHMTYSRDRSKQFEHVSATGWSGARKHVFPRLLEAEIEASQPGIRERSSIIPANYVFEMLGIEHVHERPAYVIAITPKTANKFLMHGRIWIDADEYAIARIEGNPARSPSLWIKSAHFVHTYEKRGSLWFPAGSRSVTDVRIFGITEVTIEYLDYAPGASAVSAPHEPRGGNLPGNVE